MGILAVQEHVKGLLDGLTTPQLQGLGLAPANAFVAPPVVATDAMTAPEIYVWGTTSAQTRLTAPRPVAFRKAHWPVDIYLYMMASSQPDDITFPGLIDATIKVLVTDTIPVVLADPLTGDQSQMVAIGEEINIDYTTPEEVADQRTFLYVALIRCTVEELQSP